MATVPVKEYDFVINDFEPITAWGCRMKGVPCIGLSHQSAVISPKAPRPEEEEIIGNLIINHYAPTTYDFGFHFLPYDNHIFTPVIRGDIRVVEPRNFGHYTVYLPAYSTENILEVLENVGLNDVEWHIFSKREKEFSDRYNYKIFPISADAFSDSMSTAEGVLCGAGFETPAETLFLKKKLMVVPMKHQYEQQCNAQALKEMGVPVLRQLGPESAPEIRKWVRNGTVVNVDYPDITRKILEKVIEKGLSLR